MNSDLISREALKRALYFVYNCAYIDSKSKEGIVCDVIDVIDNAPTVVNEYTKGFADGERSGRHFPLTDEEKAILVRQWQPQGEWVHRETMDFIDENHVLHQHFMCKDCGFIHDFIDGHTSQYKFCPQCGTMLKMTGGNDYV